MALKKQCSYHGCKELVDYNAECCSKHEGMKHKDYNMRRKQRSDGKKYDTFYGSGDWDDIRQYTIVQRYGIDVLEYYRTGLVTQGRTVHHIVCLEDDWSKRLTASNLVYLTESNHKRVHAQYDKGIKDKEKMQSILFNLLDKFDNEFGTTGGLRRFI